MPGCSGWNAIDSAVFGQGSGAEIKKRFVIQGAQHSRALVIRKLVERGSGIRRWCLRGPLNDRNAGLAAGGLPVAGGIRVVDTLHEIFAAGASIIIAIL